MYNTIIEFSIYGSLNSVPQIFIIIVKQLFELASMRDQSVKEM